MWIEQWVGCAKNLCQWDTLSEYARSTHNHELNLDCLWRLQDWVGLKETLTTKVSQVCSVAARGRAGACAVPGAGCSKAKVARPDTAGSRASCSSTTTATATAPKPPPSRPPPPAPAPPPQVEESPQMLMIKSYLALQDNDIPSSEQRTSQATIAALLRWWQLPEVGTAPQAKLLQTFQQLVRGGALRCNTC